jgi:hypothetical protein
MQGKKSATGKGSLYKPMPSGTGVDDGVKERIKKENRELRKHKKEKNKR